VCEGNEELMIRRHEGVCESPEKLAWSLGDKTIENQQFEIA
jgi:hypothetical protein